MQVPNQTKYAGEGPTEEATMRRGTARALAALPLPADAVLSASPSRPRGVVEAAAKERDAVGRSAQEGRRVDPARGGAVLASAAMVSIPFQRAEHAIFGLGETADDQYSTRRRFLSTARKPLHLNIYVYIVYAFRAPTKEWLI